MAISKLGVIQPRFPFVGGTFEFLWHNFVSRYARKPIKGSKDSDNSLLSKRNLIEKIASLDWCPGPRKVGQKTKMTPPLVSSPPENPKPKTKTFFCQSQLEDLLNP